MLFGYDTATHLEKRKLWIQTSLAPLKNSSRVTYCQRQRCWVDTNSISHSVAILCVCMFFSCQDFFLKISLKHWITKKLHNQHFFCLWSIHGCWSSSYHSPSLVCETISSMIAFPPWISAYICFTGNCSCFLYRSYCTRT